MKMKDKTMIRKYVTCLCLSAMTGCLFSSSPALAQGEEVKAGTETDAERSKVYMKLGTVTVTADALYMTSADQPASVDVVAADQIETENVDFSMELMKKVPGTYFGDWNQGVVSGTFSMRGFDSNHDVPATLIVDGIPHNFGYGRMDIQPFLPMEIERLEVVKGTGDPRYGLQNIAGNVNLHTKRGGNTTKAKLLSGSFNTYDASLITGHEEGNFSQNYFVGYRQSDGFRKHSDLRKGAASGKWFYTTTDGDLSIGAIARVFGMDANAPGYMTLEQAANTPEYSPEFARTDGGTQDDQHLSLHVDYDFNENAFLSLKTYGQEIERTRWARWSNQGKQQERFSDDKQFGAIFTLSYETDNAAIQELKLDWGLDFQYQNNKEMRWTTVDRVRQGTPVRDWDFNKSYWGSYIQADGLINDWLRLIGALRVDSFTGDFENRLSQTASDMLDMDFIWQPKVGMQLTPLKGYSLYANCGRTFQLPGTPQLFGQDAGGNLISRELGESENDGWELGVKFSPYQWLSVRLDYWNMTASDEVRDKKDGSGDFINSGETERKGWDMAFSVRPVSWASLWGSYSMVKATYTDPGPGLDDRLGKDIENIPDYTAKLGLDLGKPSGLFGSLWLESQGDYYVDPQNETARVGDYNVWNAKMGYRMDKTAFGLEIKNLLDEEYIGFAWNNTSGFSPGDERSAYAWVTVEF
ncbi:MAG: TonB-dependent receptor [Candidatus Electrothrix sp. EH2]|nr:TonB-dependent receptor [Candidatus Electrothrix sp. EH2]